MRITYTTIHTICMYTCTCRHSTAIDTVYRSQMPAGAITQLGIGLMLLSCRCASAGLLPFPTQCSIWLIQQLLAACVECLQASAGALDALTQPAAPQVPVAAPVQSQLGLQEHQLRQLAALLGSANMAALQSMPLPPAAPHTMPDNTAR